MEKLFGKLSLSAACESGDQRDNLVAAINEVVKPPTPLAADDVYLGALYAASNQVNLQGGCFAQTELEQLAELVVGAPILVGHQKQQLPIGRAFKAEIVTRENQPWLKVWFYWSRKQIGADQLKAGIDTGIYSECSLAFQYGKPECGICRADMRRCRHRIGQPVQLGGREIRAFYYYKELARVLEISLVYRGAVEGTKVEALAAQSEEGQAWTPAAHAVRSDQCAADPGSSPGQVVLICPNDKRKGDFDPFWRNQAKPVYNLTELEKPLSELIAEPLYNGLWCLLDYHDDVLKVITLDGGTLDLPILSRVQKQIQAENFQVLAQVYPVKGGSRLPLHDLLSGKAGKVKIALFDLYELSDNNLRELPLQQRKKMLGVQFKGTHDIFPAPYRFVKPLDLDKLPRRATNLGLLLSAADQPTAVLAEYRSQFLLRIKSDSLKVQGVPTNIEADHTIWVHRESDNKLRFVDLCQPGICADEESLLSALTDKHGSGNFHLLRDQAGDSWLSLDHDGTRTLLRIRKLNLDLLRQRRHFWCELIESEELVKRDVHQVTLLDKGEIVHIEHSGAGGISLQFNGEKLRGHYRTRPVTVGGRSANLFCTAAARLKEQHDGLE